MSSAIFLSCGQWGRVLALYSHAVVVFSTAMRWRQSQPRKTVKYWRKLFPSFKCIKIQVTASIFSFSQNADRHLKKKKKKKKKFFLFLRRDLDRSTRRMARLKSLRRSFLFSLCAFLVVLFCFCLSKYREKFPVAMMIHWIWTLFVINRIIICDRKRETLV